MNSKITLVLATAFTSQSVLAHSGHDHSHWMSNPIHILSVIAIASIAATAVFVLRKKKHAQK